MNKRKIFVRGFKAMLPITTGIIPFGSVMGTVASDADLSFFQSTVMNIIVFAGAAQLAAVDLMVKHTAAIVVICTGLIINLRFLLYSAALAPTVQGQGFFTKLLCAYCLTDQNYAVMTAHEKSLRSNSESMVFYLGASLCMFLVWQMSVVGGFVFGNFSPKSWSLDYAVPLSFVALVTPTLKNRKYVAVAVFSSIASLLLNSFPYRLGLIATAILSIGLAAALTRSKGKQ